MINSEIKVFIVDDHSIFRNGLKAILEDAHDIRVIDEAESGMEFIKKLPQNKPDLVLMDIRMPEMNGMEATRRALKIFSDIKVIALSMFDNTEYLRDMIDAGAVGYLMKDVEKEILLKVIDNVCRKDAQYYTPNLLKSLTASIKTMPHKETSESFNLSDRELEILKLIGKGYSNVEIGERLFISPRTVGGHRNSILKKLNVKNTANMISIAIENKLI